MTDKTATLTPAISEREVDWSPERSELLASRTNSFCCVNYAPAAIKPAYRLKLFILCLSLLDYIRLAPRLSEIDARSAPFNFFLPFFNFLTSDGAIFAVEFISDVYSWQGRVRTLQRAVIIWHKCIRRLHRMRKNVIRFEKKPLVLRFTHEFRALHDLSSVRDDFV